MGGVTQRVVLAGIAAMASLMVGLACGEADPSGPTISRDEIVRKAADLAKRSEPEMDIREARIADTTAELITLGEADHWQGLQGPVDRGSGRDPQSPVWWVDVRGSYTYAGMAAPGSTPVVYRADERIFAFGARTGELLDGEVPSSQPSPSPP